MDKRMYGINNWVVLGLFLDVYLLHDSGSTAAAERGAT